MGARKEGPRICPGNRPRICPNNGLPNVFVFWGRNRWRHKTAPALPPTSKEPPRAPDLRARCWLHLWAFCLAPSVGGVLAPWAVFLLHPLAAVWLHPWVVFGCIHGRSYGSIHGRCLAPFVGGLSGSIRGPLFGSISGLLFGSNRGRLFGSICGRRSNSRQKARRAQCRPQQPILQSATAFGWPGCGGGQFTAASGTPLSARRTYAPPTGIAHMAADPWKFARAAGWRPHQWMHSGMGALVVFATSEAAWGIQALRGQIWKPSSPMWKPQDGSNIALHTQGNTLEALSNEGDEHLLDPTEQLGIGVRASEPRPHRPMRPDCPPDELCDAPRPSLWHPPRPTCTRPRSRRNPQGRRNLQGRRNHLLDQ